MKRTFFIFLFTAFYLIAQSQTSTPEQRAQRYLDGPALNSLNLTSEQKSKALSILVGQYKTLDSLSATAANNEAAQSKRVMIMQAGEARFRDLLTDQQKATYNTAVQARPQGAGFGQGGGQQSGGQGGNRFPATPEIRAQQIINSWMFEPFNLTAEQKDEESSFHMVSFPFFSRKHFFDGLPN